MSQLLSSVFKESSAGKIKAEIYSTGTEYVISYKGPSDDILLETQTYSMNDHTLQQVYRLVEQKLHSIGTLNG